MVITEKLYSLLPTTMDQNEVKLSTHLINYAIKYNLIPEMPDWIKIKSLRFLLLNFEVAICQELISKSSYLSANEGYETFEFLIENVNFFSKKNIDKYIDSFNDFKEKYSRLIYPTLLDIIIYSLANNKGFSFIRLGDGEGNVLGLKNADFNILLTKHSNDICELQFGSNIVSFDNQNLIANYLLLSIQSCDVLGVMTPDSIIDTFDKKLLPYTRQLTGNVINYLILANFEMSLQFKQYIDSSINYDPYWENVIKNLALSQSKLGIIGPHISVKNFFINAGVKDVIFFQIPGEHKYFPHSESHFHNYLPSISSSISSEDLSGRLFLVGAGLLGKYYCHLIKQSNGVALDIGSTMDRMADKGYTRGI